MMYLKIRLVSGLLALAVVASLSGLGFASSKNTITVAPAQITVVIRDTEIDDQTISLANNFETSVRLNLELSGVDDTSGKPSPGSPVNPTIQSMITFSETDVTLNPKQSRNIKVHINDSQQLSPGGHFSSILIKQINNGSQGVGLQPNVSVGLYLIKETGAKRQMDASISGIPGFRLSLPRKVNVNIKNTGNVILIPQGFVSTSKASTTYQSARFNQETRALSPGSQQAYSTDMTRIKTAWMPGKYNLDLQYRFIGQENASVYHQAFFYFPWQLIILIFVLVLILRKPTVRFWANIRKKIAKTTKKSHKNDATSNKIEK